jgi:uncharacterized protein (DUF2236 family)
VAQRSQPVGRKINRETVVLVGWGRAILLQLAHPLVAAGVADHSDFREGAGGYLRRVRQTVGAMLSICFGTPAEADRAIGAIKAVHDRVHGQLAVATGIFPAGTPYSAHDPALLMWVHATLVDSLIQAYELLVGPLTADEKTGYVAEAGEVAVALGVPAALVPQCFPDLVDHLENRYRSGEISVGDSARGMASALLRPPLGPAALLFGPSRLLTLGLLPDEMRHAYGFAWPASRERSYRRLAALARGIRPMLPGAIREWPVARAA